MMSTYLLSDYAEQRPLLVLSLKKQNQLISLAC
jgi:hypothetical protein